MEAGRKRPYRIKPELAAALLAALVSCSRGEKNPPEPEVIPGEAHVESAERRRGSDLVYKLIKREIGTERQVAFEAILEDESLRYYQTKFSSPEDVRRDKRDYTFYSKKIESLFANLKNETRRQEVFGLIEKYCREEGVPYRLALAVMAGENAGRSGPVSSAGARGIFQVMPDTAREMGVSEKDLQTLDGQIKAGVRALGYFYSKYHNWGVALSAYNGGSGDTANFLSKHGFLPKEHKLKSVERNFGGNIVEFYGGRVPDIVAMYEKSYDKPSLGYVFRVIAMSRILDAIEWSAGGRPFRVNRDRLPHSELWDRKNITPKDNREAAAAGKRHASRSVKPIRRNSAAGRGGQPLFASTWKKRKR